MLDSFRKYQWEKKVINDLWSNFSLSSHRAEFMYREYGADFYERFRNDTYMARFCILLRAVAAGFIDGEALARSAWNTTSSLTDEDLIRTRAKVSQVHGFGKPDDLRFCLAVAQKAIHSGLHPMVRKRIDDGIHRITQLIEEAEIKGQIYEPYHNCNDDLIRGGEHISRSEWKILRAKKEQA